MNSRNAVLGIISCLYEQIFLHIDRCKSIDTTSKANAQNYFLCLHVANSSDPLKLICRIGSKDETKKTEC